MPLSKAVVRSLLPALALLAIAAGPASGATTSIGAVNEIRTGTPPTEPSGGGDTAQIGQAVGTYAVPGGYGVITAWEHRTGSVTGTLKFKVYRPTGTAGTFLTVASNPRIVTAGAGHLFAVRIPVRAGDRLGLSSADNTVHLAYQTFDMADQFVFFPRDSDPAAGSTVTQDGAPATGLKLDVAARVETDGDRDGFGDDTQDRCPSSAATQGPCPAGGSAPLPPFAGCSTATANLLRGGAGPNTITGTPRGDRIFAGAGDDKVNAHSGDDCIALESGKDRGTGGSGDDRILGGSGGDRLSGGSGNDRLLGDSGNDRLSGAGGRDAINGGSGNDSINGGSGSDRLTGGSGRDRILGSSGNDRIAARDRKHDRISCGRGRDSVTADRGDRVARDCERVRLRACPEISARLGGIAGRWAEPRLCDRGGGHRREVPALGRGA